MAGVTIGVVINALLLSALRKDEPTEEVLMALVTVLGRLLTELVCVNKIC